METKKNWKLYLISGFLGLGLITYLATNLIPKAIVTFTKAAPAQTVSLVDSKVIGEKILAKADDKDNCVVDVFVMDSSGKGVANKQVILSGAKEISPASVQSDNDGKASFNIKSTVEGQFSLEADIEGIPMQQGVKVTFRN